MKPPLVTLGRYDTPRTERERKRLYRSTRAFIDPLHPEEIVFADMSDITTPQETIVVLNHELAHFALDVIGEWKANYYLDGILNRTRCMDVNGIPMKRPRRARTRRIR